MSTVDRYPNYRAPQSTGDILCAPSWSTIQDQLATNRQALDRCEVQIADATLAELSRQARSALLTQARTYTSSYSDAIFPSSENYPLILTGHQPEFVHPGVWLKNYFAAALAEQLGGTAINLVIDSDLCRAPSIRVPTGTVTDPQSLEVAFDRPGPEMPYEQRAILDRPLWNSFGERVTRALEPFVSEPLISLWWSEVVRASAGVSQVGLAIAQARHRVEQDWGCQSLQIPQSLVCQTAPFRRFAIHLLKNAGQLRHDYNASLADYRRAHRLRSAAQPLPDLTVVENWTETPFWIWSSENPTRRALFVQSNSEGLVLSDRQQWQGQLPPGIDDQLQQLERWQNQGIKLRTRALITTLYARLLLADTFIHGIGGAKYDQVTDALAQRLFGIQPPSFVVLSGTLRLPIEHPVVTPTHQMELRQQLRSLRYHPETQLETVELDSSERAQVDDWIAQKTQWIKTPQTNANAAQRHAQIVAANEALRAWLEPQRNSLEDQLAACLAQTRKNRVLESREYPFCLFPQQILRQFLLDFSQLMP